MSFRSEELARRDRNLFKQRPLGALSAGIRVGARSFVGLFLLWAARGSWLGFVWAA